MEMTRQRHSESVRSAVYDDCPYCKGRGKVKSAITMSVEIQRKLNEILKKRSRDDSDFQLRIAVHPTVLERLRTEDEKLIIEMEKRYFGKLSFRPGADFSRGTIQNRQRGHKRGTGKRRIVIANSRGAPGTAVPGALFCRRNRSNQTREAFQDVGVGLHPPLQSLDETVTCQHRNAQDQHQRVSEEDDHGGKKPALAGDVGLARF